MIHALFFSQAFILSYFIFVCLLGSVILTLSQVPRRDPMFPYIVCSYLPFVSEQFPFHFQTYHLVTSFTIITSIHLVVSHLSRTQDIVTKINILLQEIRDIKLQKQKKNIFNDHKNHPKGTGEENDLDDTRSIYNSASTHLLPDKPNTPEHCVPNPTHIPDIDDNAFVQQKLNPYELWSTSPPESLSSSSSVESSSDDEDESDSGGKADHSL